MNTGNQIVCWCFVVFVILQITSVSPDRIPTNYVPSMVESIKPISPRDISCYRRKCFDNCDQLLPLVDKHFRPPKNTIYFIETSCKGGLQSRAACSVESAAYANPNWKVVILFAGPLKPEFWDSMTFSRLRSIPNLYFYRLYPAELAEGTIIGELFLHNILLGSKYPVVHCADLLRLLVLYKYGGLYLDLDMIVMKSFDSLPKNFIARESKADIASGIIAATKNAIGRKFTEISMRNLGNFYDPVAWAGITNSLYTKTLQEICNTTKTSEMNETKCQGFHVLEDRLFYPVDWNDWILYYRPGIELPVDSAEYTHHFWNSFGSQVRLEPTSYLTRLAEKYCPQIYDLYKDRFGQ